MALAWLYPVLLGYLIGRFFHIGMNILVDGKHILRRRVLFDSFVNFAYLGFSADRLITRLAISLEAGKAPIR